MANSGPVPVRLGEGTASETPTGGPTVVQEALPPSTPTGPPPTVVENREESERAKLDRWLTFLEFLVYALVLAMLVVAAWVNLWVAYWHADPSLLPRFTADAEFTLAAGAILLIAFEFRKERKSPRRPKSAS